MIRAQWLLQSNHPNLGTITELAAILENLGRSVHQVALKAHSAEMPLLHSIDPTLPVVCYGPSFVPRAYRYPGFEPGIFFDHELFSYTAFQRGWGELMLSRDAKLVAIEDVKRTTAEHGTIFVRPDEDNKLFDGGIYDTESVEAIVAILEAKDRLSRSTGVIVAPIVEIEAEWRTFVVDGEVVAASSYRVDGKANIDAHVPYAVIDLVYEAVERWRPDTVFCLDVARSKGRYGVVEANCFNAARLYGANARAILQSVSEFVEATFG
jgi:hypothetical protein